MNGKQFIAATLFALVLLILIFIPLAHQQDSSTYDPWLDYNGDGIIDANDLQEIGQTYGTSGSRTRNMNITNWPVDEQGNLRIKAAEKAPEVFRETFRIVVFSSPEILGIWGRVSEDYPMKLNFAFSPKQPFLNVTDLVVAVTATSYSADPQYMAFNATWNGKVTMSSGLVLYQPYSSLTVVSARLENPDASISQGINELTLSTFYVIAVFEVVIFIEYEYQA